MEGLWLHSIIPTIQALSVFLAKGNFIPKDFYIQTRGFLYLDQRISVFIPEDLYTQLLIPEDFNIHTRIFLYSYQSISVFITEYFYIHTGGFLYQETAWLSMILFRSGTNRSGPMLILEICCFLPQNSALAIGVYFCLFLLGPKNDYIILGPLLKKETFFVGIYGISF